MNSVKIINGELKCSSVEISTIPPSECSRTWHQQLFDCPDKRRYQSRTRFVLFMYHPMWLVGLTNQWLVKMGSTVLHSVVSGMGQLSFRNPFTPEKTEKTKLHFRIYFSGWLYLCFHPVIVIFVSLGWSKATLHVEDWLLHNALPAKKATISWASEYHQLFHNVISFFLSISTYLILLWEMHDRHVRFMNFKAKWPDNSWNSAFPAHMYRG